MRELNRLGVTSAIDAGGGYQNFPQDYEVIDALHRQNQLTLRIAYNLFTQRPKEEYEDFASWMKLTAPGRGDDFYRMNGAGEMLSSRPRTSRTFASRDPICRPPSRPISSAW